MISVVIEEYERGAWVADLVDLLPYVGTFTVNATDQWIGTAVSSMQEAEKYMTRIVGGAGQLATVIPDRYYNGSVSVGAAVADICSNAGEAVGVVAAAKFLTTYERLRASAAACLDTLADVQQLTWWIDRLGLVNMQAQRTPGPEVIGIVTDSGSDLSVMVTEPQGLVIGGTYQGKPIRHIRWMWSATRFAAQIYFVPFVFRSPREPSIYACQYSAAVDTDHGDGTIDVIAAGRFGVTKVPLYAGIPGAKITVKRGELVTLGFMNGDPQLPYAIANGQNVGASKIVARKGDPITAGSLQFTFVPASGPGVVPDTLVIAYSPGNGGPPQILPAGSGTITIGENINGGSMRVALDDG